MKEYKLKFKTIEDLKKKVNLVESVYKGDSLSKRNFLDKEGIKYDTIGYGVCVEINNFTEDQLNALLEMGKKQIKMLQAIGVEIT